MADYDNNDKGAAFKPFDTQNLILQGKINSNGNDVKTVLVKDVTRDGKVLIEIYEKIGVLFENDKKGNENAPDYTGPFQHRRVAAWKRVKDGKPYMTFAVSDQQQKPQQQSSSLANDDIPF